jgi:pimeloyl-ACP methyl ester carboxylesterase
MSQIPPMQTSQSGRGDPLILVPGGFTGWLSWIPHSERLSSTRRVIRVQPHNVALGLSGAPLPPGYSVDYEATALTNTLDDLHISHADIAAWSYGTLIALTHALNHPQRVRSLTLIEPSAYWVLPSNSPLSAHILTEQQFMQTLASGEVTEQHLVKFMRTFGLLPPGVDPRNLPQWPLWLEHRQSLRIGDAEYRHTDSIDRLRAFTPPVLLVRGADTTPLTHRIADVLAEELPHARLVTLPGGHAAHIESLDAFLALFDKFLGENPPAS